MDDAIALAIHQRALDALVSLLGSASPGAHVHEADRVRAAIVPGARHEPDANLVVYRSADMLTRALPGFTRAYLAAGVPRWEVLVPEWDQRAAGALRIAGYRLADRLPAMWGNLAEFRPVASHGLDYDADGSVRTLGSVNAAAYGREEMARVFVDAPEGIDLRVYQARVRGEPASVLCTIDVPHGDEVDCATYFVATHPDARTVGLAPRLLSAALVEARERGCTTVSGQASAAGAQIYDRMGLHTAFHYDRYVWQEGK